MERDIKKEIANIIASSKVVLFMKGTPSQPACGFSQRAISILRANGISKDSFTAINVLEDEEIRSGIKSYSNWPTVPQLYINHEFIGGSDIMTELNESGELKQLLSE